MRIGESYNQELKKMAFKLVGTARSLSAMIDNEDSDNYFTPEEKEDIEAITDALTKFSLMYKSRVNAYVRRWNRKCQKIA